MSNETKCPKCGGTRATNAKKTEWRNSFIFDFAAITPNKCLDCGQIWEPPAPRWLLFLGIVFGLVFIGLGVLVIVMPGRNHYSTVAAACALGILTIAGCIARLCKRGPRLLNSIAAETNGVK